MNVEYGYSKTLELVVENIELNFIIYTEIFLNYPAQTLMQ